MIGLANERERERERVAELFIPPNLSSAFFSKNRTLLISCCFYIHPDRGIDVRCGKDMAF